VTSTDVSDPLAIARTVGTRLDGTPLAVMLDVDGTLAPIAPTPQDARVPEDTRNVLRALASLPGVHLALVSGRSAADAAGVAGIAGAWVLGNHGIERRSPDGTIEADDAVRPHEAAVQRAREALTRAARTVEGTIVEDKRWTLSLHYRLADPVAVPALMDAAREVAGATGLRVLHGRKIVELRPPVDIHKGTATVALSARLGALDTRAALLFAGDDRTDEDAFTALRARKPDAVTIRVAAGTEAPAETGAEFTVGSPDALREVLAWLAARRAAAR